MLAVPVDGLLLARRGVPGDDCGRRTGAPLDGRLLESPLLRPAPPDPPLVVSSSAEATTAGGECRRGWSSVDGEADAAAAAAAARPKLVRISDSIALMADVSPDPDGTLTSRSVHNRPIAINAYTRKAVVGPFQLPASSTQTQPNPTGPNPTQR